MKNYKIYVTPEIGEKVREKGFPLEKTTVGGFGDFNVPYFYLEPSKDDKVWNNSWGCYCPTAEEVCNWLREEKGILIDVSYYYNTSDTPYFDIETFEWEVICPIKMDDKCLSYGYDTTYKGAMMKAIKSALEEI